MRYKPWLFCLMIYIQNKKTNHYKKENKIDEIKLDNSNETKSKKVDYMI